MPFQAKQIQGGIVMGYQKPIDFAFFEIYVSTSTGFNPTGWSGSAWTGPPNSPETWNGTTNTLYMISTQQPSELAGLDGGTRYYVKMVAVNKAGSRSAPSGEDDAVAGNYQQSATYSIAPFNALARSLASADYKCDGTDDQVTIQAAIDAMPEADLEDGTSQGTLVNSIANYNCESAKPTLNSASSDYRLTSTLSAVQVHGGAQALRLATASGGNNQNYFMGNNSTTDLNGLIPGRKYTFSAWGRMNNSAVADLNNVSIRFRQYYGGSWHDTLSNHPTSFQTWQQLTLDVVLDATTTGACLSIQINEDVTGVSYWDDFSLTDWNSITLESGESSTNDDFNGLYIEITSGTGAGQRKKITDYDGANKRVTIGVGDHWTTRPDATSEYSILMKCGKIVFMEGTFKVSAAIKIPSGVTIEGMGPGTVFRIMDGTNNDMNVFENDDLVNGGRDIVIRNLKINGNKKNQTGTPTHKGIFFSYVRNSIIESCLVVKIRGGVGMADGIGCHLYHCSNMNVAKSYFLENEGWGAKFEYSDSTIMSSCFAKQNQGSGFSFRYANDLLINGNVASNNYYGIMVFYSNGTAKGNNVSYNTSIGLSLWGCVDMSIEGNDVFGNGDDGIRLDASNSCEIEHNKAYGNGSSANDTYSNILVGGDSDSNTIRNNTCKLGSGTNKPKYGIRIGGPLGGASEDNNRIAGNNCTSSGLTAGISDDGNGTVIGQNFMNNGAWTTTPN